MKKLILIAFLVPVTVLAQAEKTDRRWEPFAFLIGSWEGTGEGKWGSARVTAEYGKVLNDSFLKGTATSYYEKQPKNPQGETHVNWDIISYDRARKKYVMRQFHNEYIVNRFVADSADVARGKIEFISEAVENFVPGWRAKQVFEKVSENEYIETFYLAAPGKDFQLYVTNRFQRKS